MIWYVNPGRADKNLGKGYNDICRIIPDNDWICISDQDCLWWPELVLKQVEEIVNGVGKDFSLLGCMTNRLASEYQRPFPEDFDNMDMKHHRGRAEQLYKDNYGQVIGGKRPVAGLFMLFPKKTWNITKFQERVVIADTLFSRKIISRGGKIGLMTGVYAMHWYRAQSNDPMRYKKHLMP